MSVLVILPADGGTLHVVVVRSVQLVTGSAFQFGDGADQVKRSISMPAGVCRVREQWLGRHRDVGYRSQPSIYAS